MSLSMPTTSRPRPAKCRLASEPIKPPEPVTNATDTPQLQVLLGNQGCITLRPRESRSLNVMVGKGGVEPPRPFGHTDLNRARLPFRHFPWNSGLRDPSSAERLGRHYAALGATEE